MLARMPLAILVLIVGCDQRHRDSARTDSVAEANPQPTSTDDEGIRSGVRPFRVAPCTPSWTPTISDASRWPRPNLRFGI
jgi:hypothetical protein